MAEPLGQIDIGNIHLNVYEGTLEVIRPNRPAVEIIFDELIRNRSFIENGDTDYNLFFPRYDLHIVGGGINQPSIDIYDTVQNEYIVDGGINNDFFVALVNTSLLSQEIIDLYQNPPNSNGNNNNRTNNNRNNNRNNNNRNNNNRNNNPSGPSSPIAPINSNNSGDPTTNATNGDPEPSQGGRRRRRVRKTKKRRVNKKKKTQRRR
jgi:hypothetical protein